jgi:metallo-beta-lactamase family protein
MLIDAASIMAGDARHLNKIADKNSSDSSPVVPLYVETDVTEVLSQFIGISYNRKISVAPGIDLTFMDAGHVLGSALIVLDIEDSNSMSRLVFTGDLGRMHLPILRDPVVPIGVNYLIMESTYGDRLHDPMNLTTKALNETIQRTAQRGGKVIIPSFALERAQELIYSIKKIYAAGLCPKIPVYLDSPLSIKLTEIFKIHPECFDHETFELLQHDNSPFDFPQLRYVSSTEESKRLSQSSESSIIISASGMCEGGRILHHLASTVENSKNTVLIVGFQAENTLGRRLVEKQSEIKIYGTTYRLQAEVCVLNGFSGHADQNGLLNFAKATRDKGDLRKVILVHGETPAQLALALELKNQNFSAIEIPILNQTLKISD